MSGNAKNDEWLYGLIYRNGIRRRVEKGGEEKVTDGKEEGVSRRQGVTCSFCAWLSYFSVAPLHVSTFAYCASLSLTLSLPYRQNRPGAERQNDWRSYPSRWGESLKFEQGSVVWL